ncbi:SMI1/KNR4 family protein [Saccharothrix luteola]|uniref:SMI1/KNR4 family protein n=1 Tax=Saccharothrix luteola TaxID=2893018 RepID=UPI001E3AE3C6|nr:SMI1/KNR4 family protein [Saccharothrix luteola]MCC8243382.1 SMI1/KNR4 family protein [Saccharothrix luteola]
MSESFFEEDPYYTGPPLTDGMVRAAEAHLGLRLPRTYLALLAQRNGGTPRRRCLRTPFPTSWAPDHFEIRGLRGLGGPWGIDSEDLGSRYLVGEWGYPDIGVVICDTPSGGHDTVMLDYSECGPTGEPAVAYVDEDRVPRRVAATFERFVAALEDCPD